MTTDDDLTETLAALENHLVAHRLTDVQAAAAREVARRCRSIGRPPLVEVVATTGRVSFQWRTSRGYASVELAFGERVTATAVRLAGSGETWTSTLPLIAAPLELWARRLGAALS